MAAANKRQPPPGYPTGGNAEEEASRVDNNNSDENETDRGLSARFMVGRPKPRSHERYPGPGLVPFDDYVPPPPPRGPHRAPGYDYPPPHASYGVRRHQTPVEFEVSDDEDEDEYENGYGQQQIPYGKKPQQFYRRETYVVEPSPPPPPPRRRPVPYAPEGNYYVRNEYVRY